MENAFAFHFAFFNLQFAIRLPDYEHPLVPPQLPQRKQVPARIIMDPQSGQGGASMSTGIPGSPEAGRSGLVDSVPRRASSPSPMAARASPAGRNFRASQRKM